MTNHCLNVTQDDRDRAKLRSQRKWQTDLYSNLATAIAIYKEDNKPMLKKQTVGMDEIPFAYLAEIIVCIVRDLKRLDMDEENIVSLIKTAAAEHC